MPWVAGSNPAAPTNRRVAEWFKATVLKIVGSKGSLGSNPSSSTKDQEGRSGSSGLPKNRNPGSNPG